MISRISRDNPTLLTLEGIGVPPYSARGISQTLEPIAAASQLKRTVDGVLRDLSDEQFQKYKSTISCTDQRPPSVDGKWPGQIIIVECVATLCHSEEQGFAREPVDYADAITYEAGFVIYRPRLTMMVISFSTIHDEYEASIGWSMELEEVE